MPRRRQKKARIITISGIMAALFIVAAVFVYYTGQGRGAPGYGQINQVNSKVSQQAEINVQEETGLPLMCMVIECGDALSVLIDIGQTEILYDAGAESHGVEIAEKVSPMVDGCLDYVIISHSHANHAGGIPQILERFDVETVITSGETEGSRQFEKAMQEVAAEGCDVIPDDNMNFDLEHGAQLSIYDILDPDEEDNPNNLSVIAAVTYGEELLLLTGDAEAAAEQKLKGRFSEVTVYIAGHHMSSTSNSLALLQEWMPEYIIGSCMGKESAYGFPHKEVIERALSTTPNVYATFKSGDIIYKTDGKEGHIDAEEALSQDDAV